MKERKSEMGKEKEIKYDGKIYPSKKALSEAFGIAYSTFKNRLSRGWTIDEAVNGVAESSIYSVEYNGKVYKSGRKMCEILGINYKLYQNRIVHGWTVKEAIEGRESPYAIEHKGITYASEKEMCEAFGVDPVVYFGRKRYGWTVDEALTGIRTIEKLRRTVEYDGVLYKNQMIMCEALGVSYATYSTRRQAGWTMKEALTGVRDAENSWRAVEYDGVIYKNQMVMCEELGANYNTYIDRMRRGWSMHEALTCPLRMSLGEYRIKTILDNLDETYYHNKTVKFIFKELDLFDEYDAFLDELVKVFNESGFTWSKKRITSLRYDFAVVRNDELCLFIEFDGEQHFKFVHLFFKTLERFLLRHNSDEVKDGLSEKCKIPSLRIRYDQIDYCEDMIKDALDNPEKYLIQHNTYLSNEEYWSIFNYDKYEMVQA